MKVAFPVQQDLGMESAVYTHFGSAQCFVVVEDRTEQAETLPNRDRDHQHGQCKPLEALGTAVDAVVVGGIGGGALMKLQSAGIRVYRAVEGTVLENLELVRAGRLPEFSLADTCGGHRSGGPCAH